MKQFATIIASVLITSSAFSQRLGQVNVSGKTGVSYYSILTDQDVLIRITPDGNIMDWGTELLSYSGNYYAPKLQPFMGRVEYYGPEADTAFRGKVKSIGACSITYYGHYEKDVQAGRLKSVGRLLLDYYDNFENVAFRGKLRFIGDELLQYYSSVEDELLRGRLKSVGDIPVKYYSSFEDMYLKGKIKSIGPVVVQYYSSLDRVENRGMLKSGSYRPNVAGVTYILQ
ncbi:MAG TPA: hypothetical protein VFP87_01435 [Chitinophagaceae bacterium]|nr:hypothetical protein [Chitinophagaceae bacterium]